MFEGFVDESIPGALAGVVPGLELAEHLIAAELLAPAPEASDHSPVGEAAWQAANVLDVGHRRYRPPAAMAEHLGNRDLTCTFPGCRVPAQACDLDHVVPYDPLDPDGRTAADNLGPDYRHHHRIKHRPGWAVARGPDGSLLWTTPSGRRYRTVRPVLMPITTEPPTSPPRGRDLGSVSGPDPTPTRRRSTGDPRPTSS